MAEELANRREGAGVGGWVGARRAADGRLVDVHHLVDLLQAGDAVAVAGAVLRAVEKLGRPLVEDLGDQGALAGAGDAGDANELAQGDAHVDVLEVVLAGAVDGEVEAVAGPPARGQGDLACAAQVLTGDGLAAADDLLQGAGDHHLAALLAGAGPHVDDVVGGAHHRLVVLDDEDGVAEVAQPLQGADEAGVVDRVEADGGLVADVEDAHQAGADLGGQADALGLAAGEGGGAPVQGQVVQSHLYHEVEPGADLLQGLVGDGALALGEGRVGAGQPGEPGLGLHHAQPRHFGDVLAGYGEGQGLGPEAGALAGRAGVGGHVALDLGAHVV